LATPLYLHSFPTRRSSDLIRSEVETLRGKQFQREVPVAKISEEELRQMCDKELEKEYPGPKLAYYEELLAWFDMVPPHTEFFVRSEEHTSELQSRSDLVCR